MTSSYTSGQTFKSRIHEINCFQHWLASWIRCLRSVQRCVCMNFTHMGTHTHIHPQTHKHMHTHTQSCTRAHTHLPPIP